ncbi:MAG: DEAD/DEAH box helicase [Armatimonadia bacterium]|nr:DEAD/DEAH box helicase [Armatimonadia bacterium]
MRAVKASGFTEMTPIQEQAIPQALKGRDILGTAQTGTGKTAAFVLPILQYLLDNPPKRSKTRALIVTPTRELAEQVHEAVERLGQFTPIKAATVYGGVGFDTQKRALRKGTDIIVACPGRLLDHVRRGQADLGHVEFLVLDEADRMLDMGFLPDVRRIVEETPKQRRTMLFSATFPSELDRLAKEVLHKPERVEIGVAAPAETVDHWLYPVQQQEKTPLLLRLLETHEHESVLVFTRTKRRADRLTKQVKREGYKAAVLHSDRSQGQRQRALDGFRDGKYQILIATDIAARGLDVQGISHVINYDIPAGADDYIHRIGRTGRAERTGDALTLVTADDRGTIRDIERCIGEPLPVREVDDFAEGVKIRAPRKLPQRKSAASRRKAHELKKRSGNGEADTKEARRIPRKKTTTPIEKTTPSKRTRRPRKKKAAEKAAKPVPDDRRIPRRRTRKKTGRKQKAQA